MPLINQKKWIDHKNNKIRPGPFENKSDLKKLQQFFSLTYSLTHLVQVGMILGYLINQF